MATSGSRLLIALVAGVLATASSGCGSTARPPSGTAAPAPASSASPATARPTGACRVDLPAAWSGALHAGRLAHAAGESMIVRAVADDGSRFVELTRSGRRGLVWLRDNGNTVIATLTDPREEQVVAASFDGRWLVFGVVHQLKDPNDWTIFAWDARTGGSPRQIARNRERGPWLAPVVHDGRAAWIAGAAQGQTSVHLLDLAGGRDRVVHTGPANTVFFLGDLLVWRAGYDDVPSGLRAVTAATGAPAALPEPLASLSTGQYAAADGSTVVWTLPDQRTIEVWRAGWAQPRRVITLAEQVIEWPKVTGDLVAWGDTQARFVGDLRSGSYTQVTPAFGWTDAWGDSLLVQMAPEGGAAGDSTVVRGSALPTLPGCAGATPRVPAIGN